jgi:hypothetical protein
MSIKQKRFAIHIGFIVLVSVIQLAGCNTKEGGHLQELQLPLYPVQFLCFHPLLLI